MQLKFYLKTIKISISYEQSKKIITIEIYFFLFCFEFFFSSDRILIQQNIF